MAVVRKAYVDTRDGQLHYRSGPPGDGPPVVFLHQTASSSVMFDAVIGRLEDTFATLAFDTPGFGGSYDPPGEVSIAYYTDVFMDALDRLKIERFHVVGHHTGGCMAVDMAARFPERIVSVVVIAPLQLTSEEREAFRAKFFSDIVPGPDGAYLRVAWDYLAKLGAEANLHLHHRETVDLLRAWKGRLATFRAVFDFDFPASFARVTCPLMIMCSRDDVLWPYFQRAREDRPDAEAVEVKGAIFQPDLDPDGVTSALRRFLVGVKSFSRAIDGSDRRRETS